jgi:DNA polymerase-3 subunit gamma/tau
MHIASEEGITLDSVAAWAIAKGADGGMRDAQSMLDQLVAFCGETITEANVLEIFGFTSREKVAELTSKLLSRETPATLKLIQTEAESGRELSQLLGELIGCLRGLLIAKLDPSADGEGIPEELWTKLLADADEYAPERILAAIDVFAETEGRMKWATNKRLHFELGLIKAIQVLAEVRITDIIKVLTKGADHLSQPSPTPTEVAAPEKEEAPPSPPAQQQAPEPKPEPATPAAPSAPPAKKKAADTMSAFDALIESAPDEADEPEAPIAPPQQTEEKPAPAEDKIEEDTFYKDPLIQAALEKFEAKVVSS